MNASIRTAYEKAADKTKEQHRENAGDKFLNLEEYMGIKHDELVKSHKVPSFVIPAKAGIQSFRAVAGHLDSGFHRSDDFLRMHKFWVVIFSSFL